MTFRDDATPHRLPVPPVPDGIVRPLWSVMIPTHDCADTLRTTLASVLAQDPGPDAMQIEVIDDASTRDDPAAVVAELGRGRVDFHRAPRNRGHVATFDTCLARARGHLVHLLHGDDVVRPGFYERLAAPLVADPTLGAAFCRHLVMDERGHWLAIAPLEADAPCVLAGWLERLAEGQRVQAPAIVVRRTVYERLGGFDRRIAAYGEDWEMWVRIAARYPVWYEPEPLAVYRVRSTSLSGGALRSGRNGRDYRLAIEINRASLPPERAAALSRRAYFEFALGCLRRAHRALRAGDRGAALAQAREALRSSRSPEVLARAAWLGAVWLRRTLRRQATRRHAVDGAKVATAAPVRDAHPAEEGP